MKLLAVSAFSWLAGLAGYLVIGYLGGGRVYVHDAISLGFWGGVCLGVAVPIVYLPAMVALQRRDAPAWVFPVVGAALGVIPLVLFAALWLSLAGIFSGVSVLLLGVFAVFGLCFGTGYVLVLRPRAV